MSEENKAQIKSRIQESLNMIKSIHPDMDIEVAEIMSCVRRL